VVDVKELADFANQVAAARAQAEQASAKAAFDERELQRLRTLNADNRNVSDKAVQEAASNTAANNAQVAAANATMQGVRAAVVQPDAIVSWEGRSWIYVRRAADKFARIDASLAKPGDEVVTTGAQQLLGEEMRSQLHET